MLFLKNLLFTLVVPGTVAVLVPAWVLRNGGEGWPARWGAPQLLALLPLAAGLAILLRCIWEFGRRGRGTPAPIDPPKALVVSGLYRYVRNPMYLGVLLILLGEALFFESRRLLVYAFVWWLTVHLFVLVYEEPTLAGSFGGSYTRYRRAVHRWVPGRRYGG
ncbi:MAG TPA: isoprenylcysteine carboxylmethyltransferase family protein [Thermoanaerobaculia bacterium]|nr:isoprenylcysteine carboxylmethyltransferase family protein [Thermoanaerobaculia bacterium]